MIKFPIILVSMIITFTCYANQNKSLNNGPVSETQYVTYERFFKSGPAIQVGTNAVGVSYYTAHRAETAGIETSPWQIKNSNGIKTNGGNIAIFAGKNFQIVSHVISGFGVSVSKEFGTEEREKIQDAIEIAPYSILEFEITPFIIFRASITPVAYHTKTIGHKKHTEWVFLRGGALQISYIFSS